MLAAATLAAWLNFRPPWHHCGILGVRHGVDRARITHKEIHLMTPASGILYVTYSPKTAGRCQCRNADGVEYPVLAQTVAGWCDTIATIALAAAGRIYLPCCGDPQNSVFAARRRNSALRAQRCCVAHAQRATRNIVVVVRVTLSAHWHCIVVVSTHRAPSSSARYVGARTIYHTPTLPQLPLPSQSISSDLYFGTRTRVIAGFQILDVHRV